MSDPQKFVLPSPNFNKKMEAPSAVRPHFLTPSGMTLHARHQPPPMYGKRGPTYPSKYLQKANKNKVEKTDTAQPEYCEACDMELQSNDDLRRHKLQHEKCPVDNCNYRGHPSVMDKHVATLHSSGLFDKFKKLGSPEEIAAWREDRKRKYPTLENSLMRQRAKEQREKRGERLEAHKSRFGKQEDRKRAQKNQGPDTNQRGKHNQQQNAKSQNGHVKRKRNNNKRRKKEEVQNLEEKKQNDVIASIKSVKKAENNEDEDINCDGISMFKGTSKLAKYQHTKPKKSKETNVLSSLLGMYGSDEDSDNDSSKNETDSEDSELLNDDKLDKPISTDISVREKDLLISSIDTQSDSSFKVEKNEETESENIHDSSKKLEVVQPLQNIDMEINCDTSAPTISLIEKCESISDDSIDPAQSSKPLNTDLPRSDDEAPEEAPIARSTDLPSPTKSAQQNVRRNDGTSNESNQPSTNKPKKADKLNRVNKKKSGLDYRKARLRKQNTLLEKLLEPDIRHERNVLLQCVRYVCENNFFGIGDQKINKLT